MNIYLDIDGVILTKEGKQMPYLEQFIDKCFQLGDVYWLTTHCKDSNTQGCINHLKGKIDEQILEKLLKVKGTVWRTLKTEGIDFNEEFLWFDDNIFQAEVRELKNHGCEHCLMLVNENLEEITESIS